MRTLILGGVRSGKSRYAEQLATQGAMPVTVIVTATAGDAEMAVRIAAHRARRPRDWRVLEAPFELGRAIEQASTPGTVVLVDCLTLWLSNLLVQGNDKALEDEREALRAALARAPGMILLVSNEVGSGIVPVSELARRFTDEAGVLHQQLAQLCDQVVWMVAGIPVVVKPAPGVSG
jgi:adenosylcobinamide kinase / adenosylcobinamide-phosphate guanylyltransferase